MKASPHHCKRFVSVSCLHMDETQHVQACTKTTTIGCFLRSTDAFQNSLDSIIEVAHFGLDSRESQGCMLHQVGEPIFWWNA
jgi:hypothetical protein